jgi:hypothetical protein
MTSQVRTTVLRDASTEANVSFFRGYYGPTLLVFAGLPASRGDGWEREMVELKREFDRDGGKDGPIAIAADCLETVIVRA